jgi:hypothetical protein
MGSAIAPVPGRGGPLGPQRVVPPLPAGIPIMPGQATAGRAGRRFPVVLIVLLVFAGLGALAWFNVWYSDYDNNRIDPVLKRALLARVPKGTRLPVTLWSGPRLIQIELAFPNDSSDGIRSTCATLNVLDPKTGAKDPKYPTGTGRCIDGVAVTIR